jgi:hypothetical protein
MTQDRTLTARFELPPSPPSVRVTTTTSGVAIPASHDVRLYTQTGVLVAFETLAPNDEVLIDRNRNNQLLPEGTYFIHFVTVDNCIVTPDGSGNESAVQVNLQTGQVAEVLFTVECQPPPPGPPVISNPRYELVGEPGVCGIADHSSIRYTFDFTDPDGDVNSSTVRVDFWFDGVYDYTSSPAYNTVNSSDGGFSGTVSAFNCIRFGGSSSIEVSSEVRDEAGTNSNRVSQTVVRPDSRYP